MTNCTLLFNFKHRTILSVCYLCIIIWTLIIIIIHLLPFYILFYQYEPIDVFLHQLDKSYCEKSFISETPTRCFLINPQVTYNNHYSSCHMDFYEVDNYIFDITDYNDTPVTAYIHPNYPDLCYYDKYTYIWRYVLCIIIFIIPYPLVILYLKRIDKTFGLRYS